MQVAVTPAQRGQKANLYRHLRERARRQARRDTAAFSKLYRKIEPGPQQLEMAARCDDTRIKYQADFWPRDHGKTEIFVNSYPLRLICNDPNVRILIVQKTATEGKKAVSVVKTELEENKTLRADYAPVWRELVGEPDIVNKAGMIDDKTGAWQAQRIYCKRKRVSKDPTLEAVGVGGAITGGHFDYIICDDILDDENTKTEERRESIISWFFSTIMQLREPHTKIIIVGTLKTILRNLYSVIQETPIWNVTIRSCLLSHKIDDIHFTPVVEIIDGKEQVTTAVVHTPGVRVMWPAVWPIEALIVDMLGSVRRTWIREKCNDLAAMLEKIFKGHMFRHYSPADAPRFRRVIQSWDTAFKKTGDYSAMTEWGEAATGAYLRDAWQDKLEWPELALAIPLFYLCAPIRPDAVLIEDKASGQSAIQEWRAGKDRDAWLKELERYREQPGAKRYLSLMIDIVLATPGLPRTVRLPVVAVKVETDKVSRYEDASVYYAGGQVWHPDPSVADPTLRPGQNVARLEQIDVYERQLLAVPEVTNDDYADSGAQAVLYLLSAKHGNYKSGAI
jgi:phage terminase large subunit-like protein